MVCASFRSTSLNAIVPETLWIAVEPVILASSGIVPVAVVDSAMITGASLVPVPATLSIRGCVMLAPLLSVTVTL